VKWSSGVGSISVVGVTVSNDCQAIAGPFLAVGQVAGAGIELEVVAQTGPVALDEPDHAAVMVAV
jgi:hypothetical protein